MWLLQGLATPTSSLAVQSDCFRPWLASFPSQQLLVVRLDDYHAALAAALRQILAFLSLTRPPPPAWRRMLSQHRVNVGSPMRPMHDATRKMLKKFYAEFNEQLAAMMGDAGYSAWNMEPQQNRTA